MSTLSQEYKPDFILLLYTVNIFYLGVQNFAEIDFSTYQQGIKLTCFFSTWTYHYTYMHGI